MEDQAIVQLFFDRNEKAIEESAHKYGEYCMAIAQRILTDTSDAEECVNDTWLRAWNAIPPAQPKRLSLYLGKITRNLALDRQKYHNRKKRRRSQGDLAIGEIEAVFASYRNPEKEYLQKELSEKIGRFVSSLPERERNILLCRYFFLYSSEEIAQRQGMSPSHVRTLLSRMLKKMKDYLEKEDCI